MGLTGWIGGCAVLRAVVPLAIGCAAVAQAATVQIEVQDAAARPLGDAVVFLDSAEARRQVRPLAGLELAQQKKQFLPQVLVVPLGSEVHFPNHDTVRHHVYSFSPAKPFELKLYIGTPAAPVVFDKPGVVVMGCNIHDPMVAYVVVSDTPWVGVSDAAGQVRIDGAPVGEYELEYWHPRWAGSTNELARQPLRLNGADRHTLVIGAQP